MPPAMEPARHIDQLRFIALARERPSLPCLKGGAPQGRRDSSPFGRQCDFAPQNHRGVEGAAPYKLYLTVVTIYCRGRVPRPGGKMLVFPIICGESVIARFRDGNPVPYDSMLQHSLANCNLAKVMFVKEKVNNCLFSPSFVNSGGGGAGESSLF